MRAPTRSSPGWSSFDGLFRAPGWWKMAARSGSKVDFATLGGLALGVGGILGGLILEGGHVREIVAPTALIIVLGGTIGAMLISTPVRLLHAAIRALAEVFQEKTHDPAAMIEQIVDYS